MARREGHGRQKEQLVQWPKAETNMKCSRTEKKTSGANSSEKEGDKVTGRQGLYYRVPSSLW